MQSAWMLVLIMAFLVTSTALCCAQSAENDRRYEELAGKRARAVARNFYHHAEWSAKASVSETAQALLVTMFASLAVNMFLSSLHSWGEL